MLLTIFLMPYSDTERETTIITIIITVLVMVRLSTTTVLETVHPSTVATDVILVITTMVPTLTTTVSEVVRQSAVTQALAVVLLMEASEAVRMSVASEEQWINKRKRNYWNVLPFHTSVTCCNTTSNAFFSSLFSKGLLRLNVRELFLEDSRPLIITGSTVFFSSLKRCTLMVSGL